MPFAAAARRRSMPNERGTWVDADESGAQRVDVDADGRTLVVWNYGEPLWVWTYGERRWEQLRMYGEVAWYELEDGRPAWMAGVNDHAWMLERWTWAEGSVVRVDHAEAFPRAWPHAWAATAAYDSSGLVRIMQAVEKGDYRDDNRLAPARTRGGRARAARRYDRRVAGPFPPRARECRRPDLAGDRGLQRRLAKVLRGRAGAPERARALPAGRSGRRGQLARGDAGRRPARPRGARAAVGGRRRRPRGALAARGAPRRGRATRLPRAAHGAGGLARGARGRRAAGHRGRSRAQPAAEHARGRAGHARGARRRATGTG